jgi:trimethylamine-N-oxide reductase (cytochrome c)
MQRHLLVFILWILPTALRLAARLFPTVREHLAGGRWVIQLRLRDKTLARQFVFSGGSVSARWGAAAEPDAEVVFMDAVTARKMLAPKTDHAFLIDALKNFKITQGGGAKEPG